MKRFLIHISFVFVLSMTSFSVFAQNKFPSKSNSSVKKSSSKSVKQKKNKNKKITPKRSIKPKKRLAKKRPAKKRPVKKRPARKHFKPKPKTNTKKKPKTRSTLSAPPRRPQKTSSPRRSPMRPYKPKNTRRPKPDSHEPLTQIPRTPRTKKTPPRRKGYTNPRKPTRLYQPPTKKNKRKPQARKKPRYSVASGNGTSACRTQPMALIGAGLGVTQTDTRDYIQAYHLNLGYRMKFLGMIGELQLDQKETGTSLSAFRTHLRLYLGLNRIVELYPLVGIGKTYEGSMDHSLFGIDAGAGLDINLSDSISIGARYIQTFYNEEASALDSGQKRENSRFLASAQLTFYF